MSLSDKQFKALINARDNGTLRIRMHDPIEPRPYERWREDKPVPRDWCANKITDFGDCGDSKYE